MTNYTIQGFDLPTLHRRFIGFDPLFEDLTRAFANNKSDNYPPYNIFKLGENQYCIEIAVAGFQDNEIDITLTNRVLCITGEKKIDPAVANREYLFRGIGARDFERSYTLGEHMTVTGATIQNGILTVTLEQQIPEEAKPRKIAISRDTVNAELTKIKK
jgi:molecular chaperone IbpA